ncbi:MAG: hypothetical protein PHU98_06320 [Mariniphaga sp.]|nr:hypothetical protein [Mariniphaga sp.]
MKKIISFIEFLGVLFCYFVLCIAEIFSKQNLKKIWDFITDILIVIIIFVIIAMVYFTFSGCSLEKRQAYHCLRCPAHDSIITNHSVIVKDSIITIPADMAWLRMYLSCDSLYNVIVKDTAGKNGTKTVIKWKLQDNIITVTANVDSGAIIARYVNEHISMISSSHKEKTPSQNTFKSFLQWSGGILWLLLIIGTVIFIIKKT